MQMFMLAGDEWQLDARVLKWKGWANLLGLDAQYRLERVSGRYRDIEQERNDERTVYALSENPGVDLWTLSTRLSALAAVRRCGLRQRHVSADGRRRALRGGDHAVGPASRGQLNDVGGRRPPGSWK